MEIRHVGNGAKLRLEIFHVEFGGCTKHVGTDSLSPVCSYLQHHKLRVGARLGGRVDARRGLGRTAIQYVHERTVTKFPVLTRQVIFQVQCIHEHYHPYLCGGHPRPRRRSLVEQYE